MSYSTSNDRMIGSCMSHSVIARAIADEFGVPVQRIYGGTRLQEVLQQIRIVIREEARRAAEEAYVRALRVAAQHLPSDPEDGLYVPSVEIVINEGGVGRIRTRPFNSITRSGKIMNP